jgi:hypothetical protein
MLLVFISLIALSTVCVASAYAQSPEAYYDQKIKIAEQCSGNQDCFKRAVRESQRNRQNTEGFLLGSPSNSGRVEFVTPVQDDLRAMSLGQLKKALKDTKLFRELDQAGVNLKSSVCRTHWEKTIETRDALADLNRSVRNKTTDNYGKRARMLKDENIRELSNLKKCFGTYLPRYALLRENEILTFDSHASAYNGLVHSFERISDLDERVAELENELERRQSGNKCDGHECDESDIVGIVTNITGSAVAYGSGKKDYKYVKSGHRLRANEVLSTGESARLRIVLGFLAKGGPTVVNVAGETKVIVSQLMKQKYIDNSKKPLGVIELIKGTIRVYANYNYLSFLGIKAGKSSGGISGTELAVTYDPKTDKAQYFLDHGNAFVDSGGKRIAMTPRTSRAFSKGILSGERPVSQFEWSQLLTSTGEGFAESATTANRSYSDLLKAKPLASNLKTHANVAASRVKLAEASVERFFKALQSNDESLLDSSIGGAQKDKIDRNRQSQPLKIWLDGNKQRPKRFTMKCVLCDGNVCEVLAYMETEGDTPGAGKDMIFVSSNTGSPPGQWLVTASYFDSERISAFRLKPALCRQ